MPRTLIWWSTGAASAVAIRLTLKEDPEALVVRCETNNEDPDNYRFEADIMKFIGCKVTILKNDKYDSVWDVWKKERYMAGVNGAACSSRMKMAPRLAFQRPDDAHVIGFTCDPRDRARFERLKTNFPELTLRAPLIERGISKVNTIAMIERWGIAPPRSYAMGFPNANCLQTGCVKAQSPSYWALYRHHFPKQFARTAAYARELGVQLAVIHGERIFIDEIPANWPMNRPVVPSCGFLCQGAELDMGEDE